MNELRRTLKTALATSDELILATVVKTSGSVYRRPGARMLFTRDRWIFGAVSAGCIESELREQAWERISDGPALLVFDTRSDTDMLWGYGLGCPGVVEILVERFNPDGELKQIAAALEQRMPIRIATSLKEKDIGSRAWSCDDKIHGAAELLTSNGADVFAEELPAGPRLVVIGAGNNAMPLEKLAREVGWMTCVADHRSGFAIEDRFPSADQLVNAAIEEIPAQLGLDPQSFVVVMTHSYLSDLALLPALLASQSPYVGLVSSKQRTDKLMLDLGIEWPSKFHAPVGLRIKAEGPEEIAIAILAQMQGEWAQCGDSP